jgi:hypothetical protein
VEAIPDSCEGVKLSSGSAVASGAYADFKVEGSASAGVSCGSAPALQRFETEVLT